MLNDGHEVVHIFERGGVTVSLDVLKVFPGVSNPLEVGIIGDIDEIEIPDNTILHVLELAPLHRGAGIAPICILLATYLVVDTDTGLAPTSTIFQPEVVMSVYGKLGSSVGTLQNRLSDDGRIDLNVVRRGVLLHIGRNLFDKLLLVHIRPPPLQERVFV